MQELLSALLRRTAVLALLCCSVYVPPRIYPRCHVTCLYLHCVKNKCGPLTPYAPKKKEEKKEEKTHRIYTKGVIVIILQINPLVLYTQYLFSFCLNRLPHRPIYLLAPRACAFECLFEGMTGCSGQSLSYKNNIPLHHRK